MNVSGFDIKLLEGFVGWVFTVDSYYTTTTYNDFSRDFRNNASLVGITNGLITRK